MEDPSLPSAYGGCSSQSSPYIRVELHYLFFASVYAGTYRHEKCQLEIRHNHFPKGVQEL